MVRRTEPRILRIEIRLSSLVTLVLAVPVVGFFGLAWWLHTPGIHHAVSYGEWLDATLSAVTICLTMFAILMAIGALRGFDTITRRAMEAAEVAAESKAEQEIAKRFEELIELRNKVDPYSTAAGQDGGSRDQAVGDATNQEA